jgi:hypothetical protein
MDFNSLIGSLLGALIGLIGAYWIFALQQRANKRGESRKNVQLFKDVLIMLENGLLSLRQAERAYRSLHRGYSANDLVVLPRPIVRSSSIYTLDRIDRTLLLSAFREVLGTDTGTRHWRTVTLWIDEVKENFSFQDPAVLSVMEEISVQEKIFDHESRELFKALGSFGSSKQRLEDTQPHVIRQIHKIVKDVHDAGTVPIAELNERLVVPASQLFSQGMLDLTNAPLVADRMNNCKGALMRYRNKIHEIRQMADEYSTIWKEMHELGTEHVQELSAGLRTYTIK